ncbi:MAG: hypothetical protein OEY14_11085 [Myxococcales bacterium]|nr:hypothetical protein [Myxococcales bacterium]
MRHVISGVALVALGIWGMFAWWASFRLVMRGVVPILLLTLGLVALLSSYYRLSGAAGEDRT